MNYKRIKIASILAIITILLGCIMIPIITSILIALTGEELFLLLDILGFALVFPMWYVGETWYEAWKWSLYNETL